MFVWGGYDNQIGLTNDFFTLDLKTNTWSKIKPANKGPIPRYAHYSAMIQLEGKQTERSLFPP